MRKNKMMRAASALLVAVLLTTSVISGTFAKYVTTVSATDTARVARWGITGDLSGTSTFSATYDSTVASYNGIDLVVAPGTTDSGTYKLAGKPETDYEVTFGFTAGKDVFLKGGKNYTYPAPYTNMDLDLTLGADYHPITWTVTVSAPVDPADFSKIDDGKAVLANGDNVYSTMAAAAEAISNTKISYDANEECNLTVTVKWNWAFETSADNNKADTILGNIAAGKPALKTPDTPLVENTDYSLIVSYNFAITATQVN